MSGTYITHYLDPNGELVEMPGEARKLASFLVLLIDVTTQAMPARNYDTRIRCRTDACTGSIRTLVASKDHGIVWNCPACGHNGIVRNWQGDEVGSNSRGATDVSDAAQTAAISPPAVETPPKRRLKRQRAKVRPKPQPPYAVVLFNDDQHSFDYVVGALMKVFGYTQEKSHALTLQIHNSGKGSVWSGSREVAELKRDQLRAVGPDFYGTTKVDFPLGATVELLPG